LIISLVASIKAKEKLVGITVGSLAAVA